MWAGQSNARVDVPGGAGDYIVKVLAEFPHTGFIEEVVLDAYASETVEFKPSGQVQWPIGVKLDGFKSNQHVNGIYSSHLGYENEINSMPTYWRLAGAKTE